MEAVLEDPYCATVEIPNGVIHFVDDEYRHAKEKYGRFTGHSDIVKALKKQVNDFENAPDAVRSSRELAQIAVICLRALARQ